MGSGAKFESVYKEMYAKAKIGGFLHLCIGEEATVVGGTQALRDTDYLMSTYREHGQALARGTPPKEVMAELFGRDGYEHSKWADVAAAVVATVSMSSTPTSSRLRRERSRSIARLHTTHQFTDAHGRRADESHLGGARPDCCVE